MVAFVKIIEVIYPPQILYESIFFGLLWDLRPQIQDLEVIVYQFRSLLERRFVDRTKYDSKASLVYLLLSFKLEMMIDLPLGSLASLFDFDIEAVRLAYDDGNLCI